ncbi:MAG: hypothetical protein AAGE52_34590 [Myxococcota bacterium]
MSLALCFPSLALAGEASTHFSIFVPPNNNNVGRLSVLVVTAQADDTSVSIVDTDEDGDSDDSTSALLARGQSVVVRISDGAVNDDAGGVWDGDRFIIDSTRPVTAMLATRSDWQHDWVPSADGTMRGGEFFVYGVQNRWDIDVIAYEPGTQVEIYRVSTESVERSGVTRVELPGTLLLRQTLDAGVDLMAVHDRVGVDTVQRGHTYRVLTSRPTTVMFGSTESLGNRNNARDGGGYVPSEDGTTVGEHFFFPVPVNPRANHEREIRVVAGDRPATVVLNGWNNSDGWYEVERAELGAYGHLDVTGRSHPITRTSTFYEVTATAPVNVFEANWLETGSVGTSDIYTFVSALDAQGAADVGREFVAYLGPPGHETRAAGVNGTFSHLYIGGFVPGTDVMVVDADTGGTLFSESLTIDEVDDIVDVRVDRTQYAALNRPADGIRPFLRVQATQPVYVGTTNWNDNWLAFGSSVLPAGLSAQVTGPAEITCGTLATFNIDVSNDGSVDATDVVVDTAVVGSADLISGPAAIAIVRASETVRRTATLRADCEEMVTGELVGLSATVEGTIDFDGEGGRDPVGAADNGTGVSPVRVPEVAGVFDLATRADHCAIELTWVSEEDGTVEYVVRRADGAADAPTVEVGRVPSIGVSASGFAYGFRDADVDQDTPHFYYIDVVQDGEVVNGAGPAAGVAATPFAIPPRKTGDLRTDFADAGEVLPDAVDDIAREGGSTPGYDIDAVGVAYEAVHDDLYLGISTVGVFGDGDGDGDPDTTSESASEEGLVDRPGFESDETFVFVLDFGESGLGDAVVGIPFGGDLGLIRARTLNRSVGRGSPGLAFNADDEEIVDNVTVEVVVTPSAETPDLQIVVRNASLLSPTGTIGDVGVSAYIAAPSMTADIEWAPSEVATLVDADRALADGCGTSTEQVHVGTFAVFGNIFTGTPTFDFVPFGYSDTETGEVLIEAPTPVAGTVIDSPTYFSTDPTVNLTATLAPGVVDGSTTFVRDETFVRGGSFVHVVEIEHAFPPANGMQRYENIDLQVFRMITLDCSARVRVKQTGSAGVLYDDRAIRMADGSIEVIQDMNPAMTLAHSGIGTFDRGGTLTPIAMPTPDDFLTATFPEVSPEFTHYAFLNDEDYLFDDDPENVEVEPLGADGSVIEAGVWFLNHYLWTYANDGLTRIETSFEPGPDCGGSL